MTAGQIFADAALAVETRAMRYRAQAAELDAAAGREIVASAWLKLGAAWCDLIAEILVRVWWVLR